MTRSALIANHPVRVAVARTGVNPTLIVQRGKGWIKCREEGRCRMCKRPSSVRPLTRHHCVPLSWFRNRPRFVPLRHVDANIVPLCEPCHKLVERPGDHARIELRRSLSNVEVTFVLQTAGRAWLDRRYPEGEARHQVRLADADYIDSRGLRVASSPGLRSTA